MLLMGNQCSVSQKVAQSLYQGLSLPQVCQQMGQWKGPITSLTECSRVVQITFPTGHANSAGFDCLEPQACRSDMENSFSVNPQSQLPRLCFTVTASGNPWNIPLLQVQHWNSCHDLSGPSEADRFPRDRNQLHAPFPFLHWACQELLTSLVQLYPTAVRQPGCYPPLDSSPDNRYLSGRWQWLWGRMGRAACHYRGQTNSIQGNCKIYSILGEGSSLPLAGL